MAAKEMTLRFAEKFRKSKSGCWDWIATVDARGYGRFCNNKKGLRAHRVSWEIHRGPIPIGLQLDHLCRNRKCVNPEHLEPVTNRENNYRGVGFAALNRKKTHCAKGHEYGGNNLTRRSGGGRDCRECGRVSNRKSWAARKRKERPI